MSIQSIIEQINAARHIDVVLDDLTDPRSVSEPPERVGDYLVAESIDAENWRMAHFDGHRWSASKFRVHPACVWRGLRKPARPAPEVDLNAWAKAKLDDMREKTVQSLIALRNDAASGAYGESKGDEADISSARESIDARLRSANVLQKRLAEIDAALDRLGQGEYGLCEITGEEIPVARLRANPLARYTLEAQEQHERTARLFARAA